MREEGRAEAAKSGSEHRKRTGEKWDFSKFFERAHTKFLQALKETQPLGSMASFAIVIAAFSGDVPVARQYAVVAGFLFLTAFLTSTAVSIGLRGGPLELYSYFSTALGSVFVALVLSEYARASQLFGAAFGAVGDFFVSILGGISVLPWFLRDLLKEQGKTHSSEWYRSVALNLVGTGFSIFNSAYYAVSGTMKLFGGTTNPSAGPYYLLGALVGLFLAKLGTKYGKPMRTLLKGSRRGNTTGGK